MDCTCALISSIGRPYFIYKYDSFVKAVKPTPEPLTTSVPWDVSQLNPQNRINTLTPSSKWRIDGATMCGTRFFATPICLLPDLPPLRIDVYIPDQSSHPTRLREVLQSSRSVALRHGDAIANLRISRHLCRALDSYCERNPGFLKNYVTLPFGSRIVVENIDADVAKMEMSIHPAHALERQSLSMSTLRQLCQDSIPAQNWPSTIDIRSLRLIKQLHDSISLVRIAESGPEVIFKSNTADFNHLYHELKCLLTTTPHPNIISPPLNLITKRSSFGGKQGVVGFTLPYYPLGSIRDILPLRRLPSIALFTQTLRWAHQITSALIHITTNTPQSFYSDLRPDNILLSPSHDLILCDFEQRGNWHEWLPPEILFRQYAENLLSNPLTSSDPAAHRWRALIHAYTARPPTTHHPHAEPAIQAANRPWFALARPSQEKAMVYSLGLLLYCFFEGRSNPRANIAHAFPCEPDAGFPVFRRTPRPVRTIIERCTIDAPEWTRGEGALSRRARRVVRVRDRLVPEGLTDLTGEGGDVARLVLRTGMEWWESELGRAEEFLEGEEWRSGVFGRERPTLREVLGMIEGIETSGTLG